MTERERRRNGLLYDCYRVKDDSYMKARKLLLEVNACRTSEDARAYLQQMLGQYPDSAAIVPPFYCDLGPHIELGENTFLNMDCMILDEARVIFKDRCAIGPRCCFYTAIHPMDAKVRATGLEICKPIVIEEDVWMGGSCVVNGGVTIHAGSVIGSGSVVTHDIPPRVFAAGNPCRVIREIGEAEQKYWQDQYEEYRNFLANDQKNNQ
ncbi:sugar O-acetyltransferase [Erysipelotrichaceae bacterium 51-3]